MTQTKLLNYLLIFLLIFSIVLLVTYLGNLPLFCAALFRYVCITYSIIAIMLCSTSTLICLEVFEDMTLLVYKTTLKAHVAKCVCVKLCIWGWVLCTSVYSKRLCLLPCLLAFSIKFLSCCYFLTAIAGCCCSCCYNMLLHKHCRLKCCHTSLEIYLLLLFLLLLLKL